MGMLPMEMLAFFCISLLEFKAVKDGLAVPVAPHLALNCDSTILGLNIHIDKGSVQIPFTDKINKHVSEQLF